MVNGALKLAGQDFSAVQATTVQLSDSTLVNVQWNLLHTRTVEELDGMSDFLATALTISSIDAPPDQPAADRAAPLRGRTPRR